MKPSYSKSSKARSTRRSSKSSKRSAESSAVGMKPQAQPPKARPTIMNEPVKAPASYVSLLPPDAHPAIVALAQNVDSYIGASPEAKAARAERERKRAEEAAREQAGTTLRGARLDQAETAVARINFTAAAIHRLALDAIMSSDEDERGDFLSAIEELSKMICRRADVLSALLSPLGKPEFGYFGRHFAALTEEEAAKIEAEEEAD